MRRALLRRESPIGDAEPRIRARLEDVAAGGSERDATTTYRARKTCRGESSGSEPQDIPLAPPHSRRATRRNAISAPELQGLVDGASGERQAGDCRWESEIVLNPRRSTSWPRRHGCRAPAPKDPRTRIDRGGKAAGPAPTTATSKHFVRIELRRDAEAAAGLASVGRFNTVPLGQSISGARPGSTPDARSPRGVGAGRVEHM